MNPNAVAVSGHRTHGFLQPSKINAGRFTAVVASIIERISTPSDDSGNASLAMYCHWVLGVIGARGQRYGLSFVHERRFSLALPFHNTRFVNVEPTTGTEMILIVSCGVKMVFRISFWFMPRVRSLTSRAALQHSEVPNIWDRMPLEGQRKVWPHKVQQGTSLVVCSLCPRTEVVLSLPAPCPKCHCGLWRDWVTQQGMNLTPCKKNKEINKGFCWDLKAPVMHKHRFVQYGFTVAVM